MSELALYLLGPPRLELDGRELHLPRHKSLALLAYLAVTGQRHQRDTLATLFWPEYDQSGARGELRRHLSLLNRMLGSGWIDADRETASLKTCRDGSRTVPTPYRSAPTRHRAAPPTGTPSRDEVPRTLWLDVRAFEKRFEACAAHGHPPDQVCPECIALLEDAAALYRDDFLAGFTLLDSAAFDEWQLFQAQSLRNGLARVLERLARAYGERGEYEPAIARARRWLALDSLHEPAHRALMRLYAASGQRATALRQYAECERLLQEELTTSPEHQTMQLYEAIHSGAYVFEAAPPPFATAGPAGAPRDNLPVSLSSFVGRARELDELARLVDDPKTRLVTVVGPGGMGKTRLALETARRAPDRYPDGTWWIDLAPLPAAASVTREVASALGVQERPDRPLATAIADSLQGRRLLLILDNCEHLVDATAELATSLLTGCPTLTVLATSREPLHVPGEQLYPVPPMAMPEPDELDHLATADAMQLFSQRARAVRPSFVLDTRTAPLVAALCRRLDGMPLAIELAAARLRVFTLPQIVAHLDDRFRLLSTTTRGVPPRQRTLQDTVAWSYALLDETERALFDRLSVFAGSFTAEAAVQVCSGEDIPPEWVLEGVAELVDKSLLAAVPGPQGSTRYRLLETLRAYGREQLGARGEEEELAGRHAWFYVALSEAEEPNVERYGDEMLPALARLDAEEQNLAAAMRWSLQHNQPEIALRIGGALHHWAMDRRDDEYAEWVQRALKDGPDVAPLYRAMALDVTGCMASNLGRHDEALAAAQEQLDLARQVQDRRWIGRALGRLGIAWLGRGAYERANAFFQESIEIARQCDDPHWVTISTALAALSEPPAARRAALEDLLTRCPRYQREWVQQLCGHTAWELGDLKGAEARFRESRAGWAELGNYGMVAGLLFRLAQIAILQGQYARAAELAVQVGQWRIGTSAIDGLCRMGRLAWRYGDVETAARYLEEGLALAVEHGFAEEVLLVQVDLAALACEQGAYERAEAWCGAALEAAPANLGALAIVGRIALCRGQAGRAGEHFREVLDRTRRSEDRPEVAECLEHVAWALAADGQVIQATQSLACAAREREEMGIVLYPFDWPHHERALETVQDELGEAGLAAAWAEGEALVLEAAVERALAGTPDTRPPEEEKKN